MPGIDIEPILSSLLPKIGSSRVAVFFLVMGLRIHYQRTRSRSDDGSCRVGRRWGVAGGGCLVRYGGVMSITNTPGMRPRCWSESGWRPPGPDLPGVSDSLFGCVAEAVEHAGGSADVLWSRVMRTLARPVAGRRHRRRLTGRDAEQDIFRR